MSYELGHLKKLLNSYYSVALSLFLLSDIIMRPAGGN